MERNDKKKKYLKKIIGKKVCLSPISIEDFEEYTEMVNEI